MNFLQRIAVVGLALATPAIALADDHAAWIADFDKAVEAAKAQKKDMLVDFTGSDWCHWCKVLDKEVFAHQVFLDTVQKDYVLVSLDFPNSEEAKAKVPNKDRNAELAKKYSIRGYPTVLLMTAEGEVFAQTGYAAGGPEKYLESLAKLRASGRKALVDVKEIVSKFDAATGAEKVKLLDRALTSLESLEAGSPFASQLSPLARTAFVTDADNKAGHKLRAVKALLKAGEFDEELEKTGRALDPKNEQGVIERIVSAQLNRIESLDGVRAAVVSIGEVDKLGIKDAEIKENLYATAAFFNFKHLEDQAAAKSWAEKLKAIVGDKEQYQGLLKDILG